MVDITKLKAGDRIKVIDNTCYHSYEIGQVRRVVNIVGSDIHTTEGTSYVGARDIELITKKTKAENVCENCSEKIGENFGVLQDGENYCTDCHNELFGECGDCGKWVSKDTLQSVCNRGRLVCDNCISYYHYCGNCSDYVENENWDSGSDGMCGTCYDNNGSDEGESNERKYSDGK